jgi:hypothetical protein
MGKNASKNFVNQFKNTRRQAGQTNRRPLAGQAHMEPKKLVKGPARNLKKLLPGGRKNGKYPDQGDK